MFRHRAGKKRLSSSRHFGSEARQQARVKTRRQTRTQKGRKRLFAKERPSHIHPKVHLLGMLLSKTAQQGDLQQASQSYPVSGPGHGSEETTPFFPTDLVGGDHVLG